jgi:hypothetical protein
MIGHSTRAPSLTMNARDEHAVIAQPKASASTVTPPKASAAASPQSCSLPKLATNCLG